MAFQGGELVPVGGGDPIPLLRERLTIGRRDSCDIVLRFPNVSGKHCELIYEGGFWTIRDLGSTNGVKVNGEHVRQKPLSSGDTISIAKRKFTIEYVPAGQHTLDEILEDHVMDRPLLEKAGLIRPRRDQKKDR